MTNIAKWDFFELELRGPAEGNPYVEVFLEATFTQAGRSVRVPGFYDGDGIYRLRFMPDAEGDWSYVTQSSIAVLSNQTGGFTCVPAQVGAHGPVRVRNSFHFAYADGTPYLPFGTTCYAWTHQPVALQEETLATLGATRFNKLRMGVFPKDYPFNTNEPLHWIFTAGPGGEVDFDRPNLEAFRHFETQLGRLRDMGIEADIIIFHPYDRWGYCDMSAEQDYRYVAYLAARLAAYRNVWWSLANEYDFLLDAKPMEQWDRYFHILEENDPYGHLKSIHNGDVRMNFDHSKPFVSHVCIQNWDVKLTPDWRDQYGKPVVNDEPEYEGNIWPAWGNITARELVHRFWTTLMRGGYAGHGETYSHPQDIIWWAKGGKLYGQAWTRIGFLRDLLEEDVRNGLTPLGGTTSWPWSRVSGAEDGHVRYIYLGEHQPDQWTTGLPKEDGDYDVDVIDTWEMTVTRARRIPPVVPHPTRHGGIVRGGKPDAAFGVALPSKPGLAIRVRRRGS
jgi:hypothetical protein